MDFEQRVIGLERLQRRRSYLFMGLLGAIVAALISTPIALSMQRTASITAQREEVAGALLTQDLLIATHEAQDLDELQAAVQKSIADYNNHRRIP